jgi:hypothetical protein
MPVNRSRLLGWTVTIAALSGAPACVARATSLSDPTVRFSVPKSGYVVLKHGPVGVARGFSSRH